MMPLVISNTYTPKAGDIIGFRRKFYSHYAFYIGSDRYIHKDISSPLKFKAKVSIQTLSEIEGEPYVANYQFQNLYDDEICYIESLKIGLDSLEDKSYNILTNNCEHFVTNLKFKKKISKQVSNIKIYLMIFLFILLYLK